MPKLVTFERINANDILKRANQFEPVGLLEARRDYVYVKIGDEYIYQLNPLLRNYFNDAKLPDYFGKNREGAHITVIYPEEKTLIPETELNKTYEFDISGVYKVLLGVKKYYVLGITCPALLKLRANYGLGPKLLFNNYQIDLHITIGRGE